MNRTKIYRVVAGTFFSNFRLDQLSVSIRVAILCLAIICSLSLGVLPAAAQDAASESSLLERLHAARAAKVTAPGDPLTIEEAALATVSPPLPFDQPQLGPLVKPEPKPILATNSSVIGVTGTGYGASDIGSGRAMITNPDDMDARSTELDLDVATVPETFEFPDVEARERWIRVDLTRQQVIAYEGLEPVRAFLISSGRRGTPTVTGEFRIRMKVSQQIMSGPGYYLPGVKWVMYFHDEYALHGSYWHENFGNPMSHGCINMTNADAKWLFDWTGPEWDGVTVWYPSTTDNPGTRVVVHM